MAVIFAKRIGTRKNEIKGERTERYKKNPQMEPRTTELSQRCKKIGCLLGREFFRSKSELKKQPELNIGIAEEKHILRSTIL